MTGLLHDAHGGPWATGGARLLADFTVGSHVLPLAVYCRLGGKAPMHAALVDTGATWTVVPRDLIEELEVPVDDLQMKVRIESRFGSHSGTVVGLHVTLLAEPGRGVDLDVTGARAVMVEGWPGPTVLGFHGVLEIVRLGIDPGARDGDGVLYFGPVE